LGGSHHNAADRQIAERILLGAPHLVHVVRSYRAFLGRVVRYLVEVGVRQFLDLGSGLPTAGNVHEVAQDFHFECRVVYVDIDPGVVAEGDSLLAENRNVAMLRADLSQPERVLDATRRCGLFDLGAPVAVLATDVLQYVPDANDPAGFMAVYMDAVCPGSYMSVAHSDYDEALVAGLTAFRDFCQISVPSLTFRDLAQIAGFFDRLDLVEPGIVPVPLWRPELNESFSTDPEGFSTYCGLGRK
jgi:S-adenosyl methyltransferase